MLTKLAKILSSPMSLLDYGIPEGLILRPFLFCFEFSNDLSKTLIFKTTLFANDTNLHLSHSNTSFMQFRVQQEMIKIRK